MSDGVIAPWTGPDALPHLLSLGGDERQIFGVFLRDDALSSEVEVVCKAGRRWWASRGDRLLSIDLSGPSPKVTEGRRTSSSVDRAGSSPSPVC